MWGCEAPAKDPVFFIDPCSACEGQAEACKVCNGDGREAIHRCPMLWASEVIGFLDGYALYKKGMLPEPGGWLDQPNGFIDACLYLDGLISVQTKHSD